MKPLKYWNFEIHCVFYTPPALRIVSGMPNRSLRYFALAVLMLPVLLAGCEWARLASPPAPPPVQEPAPPPPVDAPAPPRATAPLPTRKPAQPAAPAAPVPATQEPMARPPVVVGLNRDMLIQQFGAPAAEHEAPPARVLEFGKDDCRLAAYLYFDTSRNDFYTLQYEVNGLPAPHAAVDQCLSRIARDASRR
ncbi:hypothetical protein [Ferrovibrio terrae]|uniref:hypothetical protein n=1 Tax=Ferrovibrio terrae TaxID=2594003 RepID=UPI003138240B